MFSRYRNSLPKSQAIPRVTQMEAGIWTRHSQANNPSSFSTPQYTIGLCVWVSRTGTFSFTYYSYLIEFFKDPKGPCVTDPHLYLALARYRTILLCNPALQLPKAADYFSRSLYLHQVGNRIGTHRQPEYRSGV